MRILTVIFLIGLWILAVPTRLSAGALLLMQRAGPTETPTALPTPGILSPMAGQAVQGRVPIIVFTAVQNFQSGELYFGYTKDRTGTWFLITQNSEPVMNGEMGAWETNLITDGDYNLRLVVIEQDGSRMETTTSGIRVRNYSMIETSTPTPETPTATLSPDERPTATATPSPTVTASPTLLPTNPAELTDGQISNSLMKGAMGAILIFVIVGSYIWIRHGRRKERIDGTE
jgi:hypothetical protein